VLIESETWKWSFKITLHPRRWYLTCGLQHTTHSACFSLHSHSILTPFSLHSQSNSTSLRVSWHGMRVCVLSTPRERHPRLPAQPHTLESQLLPSAVSTGFRIGDNAKWNRLAAGFTETQRNKRGKKKRKQKFILIGKQPVSLKRSEIKEKTRRTTRHSS